MNHYKLVESDNNNTSDKLNQNTQELADKVLSPKYEKLVNATILGSAGAMAYVTYLNRELLIGGWKGFLQLTSECINNNTGYFEYLKGLVIGIFRRTFRLAYSMIKQLTSGQLKLSSIKAGTIGAGGLFCIGTIAALIGLAIYKIYRIIKKKTPYNVNESEYLKVHYKQIEKAIKETSTLFNSLRQLTENDSAGSTQKKAEAIIKKSQSPLKEMWNWVLTSKKVKHGALYTIFFCLIALCVGTVFCTITIIL